MINVDPIRHCQVFFFARRPTNRETSFLSPLCRANFSFFFRVCLAHDGQLKNCSKYYDGSEEGRRRMNINSLREFENFFNSRRANESLQARQRAEKGSAELKERRTHERKVEFYVKLDEDFFHIQKKKKIQRRVSIILGRITFWSVSCRTQHSIECIFESVQDQYRERNVRRAKHI